jgi:hypothetical protein
MIAGGSDAVFNSITKLGSEYLHYRQRNSKPAPGFGLA